MSNKYCNLYKNKYLKYKNKYSSLKNILGGNKKKKEDFFKYNKELILVNRQKVEKWKEDLKSINIFIEYTINDDIVDGSKIFINNLSIKKNKDTLQESIYKILQTLKDFNITGDLNLSYNELQTLPENFCSIKVGGDLNLSYNELQTLPENFHHIEIGGNLNLSNNLLEILPNSFGYINIQGTLNLMHNNIKTLPESFSNIKLNNTTNDAVEHNLLLDFNQLESLPESFGSIKVDGNMSLSNNLLKTLPEDFGSIKVDGNMSLSNNLLKTLPEGFGNIEVGGNLYLDNNLLKILSKDFENITVGGNLYLDNNLLKTLPEDRENSQPGRTLVNLFNDNVIRERFKWVKGKLFLTKNYIKIMPKICKKKERCELDNHINTRDDKNIKCNVCGTIKKIEECVQCAICKVVWYCSEKCEISSWTNHSIVCNNVINTTFIVVAHGVLENKKPTIINNKNMNIITLNDIGTTLYFDDMHELLIQMYTDKYSLFENNDKDIIKTDSGKDFERKFKRRNPDKYNHINLLNRSEEQIENLNNLYLEFSDERPEIAQDIKITCIKKHENNKLEINDKYSYNLFNKKNIYLDDMINKIVEIERNINNNRGHITFILNVCRGFIKKKGKEYVNKLMRQNSNKTKEGTTPQ
jgi:hypothetical protein